MRRKFDIEPIAVMPESLENLNWQEFFGNANPVEVEIGTGKAGFLLGRARRRPDLNFLGIEWANKFYRFAADRMRRWGVENVRMVRMDADHFIRVLCPRQSLSVLHVYHPDPWPKARQHKRRLFQKEFIAAATECLIPGGRISVQTDHAEYFAEIHERLLAHPELSEVEFSDPAVGIEGEVVETNFEVKYEKEGREFYRVAVERGC